MKGKQGRGKHALRAGLEKEAILLHCMLVLTIRRCLILQHKNLKEGSPGWGGGGSREHIAFMEIGRASCRERV